MRFHSAHLLLMLDLLGVALFAAEGAGAAVYAHLDLLGILALSFITAEGGGILRDLLIGYTPPSAIRDWRYPATALVSGLFIFLLHLSTPALSGWLLTVLDAAGLSFFAVAGAAKSLDLGIHPLLAVMMGGITAVGGGTLQDLILRRVPTVLTSDIYATAALLGAAVTILLLKSRVRPLPSAVLGIVVCFVLRMVAVGFHLNLPRG